LTAGALPIQYCPTLGVYKLLAMISYECILLLKLDLFIWGKLWKSTF